MSKIPEGATHTRYGMDSSEYRRLNSDGSWDAWWPGCTRWIAIPDPRPDLYQPIAAQGWNGEGLPPVGTVCSACVKNGPTWLEITVLAVTGQHLIAREGAGDEFSVRHIFWEFRPIRTAEQIAAEERAATIKTILADAGVTDSAWNDDPEAEVWAAALYDAGYRKQVQP